MNTKAETHLESIDEIFSLKQRIRELEQSESEEYFKAIIENSSDIVLILDKLGTITYASPSVERILGYRPDELIGKSSLKLIVSDDKPRAIADFGGALLTKEVLIPNVFRIRHKNGTERILEGFGKNLLDNLVVAGFVMNVRDITERKRIEEALQESQAFYHSLVEQLPAGVFRKDAEGRFVFVSPGFCRLKGMKEEEFLGKTPQDVIASEAAKPDPKEQGFKYAAEGADHHVRIMQNGNPIELVEEYTDAAGGKQFVQAIKIPVFNSEGKVIGTQGILFDITERKLAEEALESEHTLLQNLIDNVPDRIYAKDSEGRFIICNEAMIRRMGKTSLTELVGKSDFDLLPLEMAQRFHADEQAVIQSGIPMINREEPLTIEGGTITRWNLATKVPLLDKQNNRIGIVGVGREITDLKLTEQKLKDTLESLRKAVGVTIQVMVSAVEARDPYTSGHQTRSADLARAIATEMGLPPEQIEGIRMAGSIHDIGKLSIPAEILSKPTKLSDIEFRLIKEHARQGYEILKDVESPWPLAEIVHQHHERMDGSGYPRNLKGDEILIEARILSVADVVEAMASHRPYRPGLGIDAALDEIEKNRGTLYDNAVANVCLMLFREKGFQLEKSRF